MQRDSSPCSLKFVGNDEVNNITLMLFWKIACCVPVFTPFKKKKSSAKETTNSDMFLFRSLQTASEPAVKQESRPSLFALRFHPIHSLTDSHTVTH